MSSTTSPRISPSTPSPIDLAAQREGHTASLHLSHDDLDLADSPPTLHDQSDGLVVTAALSDASQALDNRVDPPPPLLQSITSPFISPSTPPVINLAAPPEGQAASLLLSHNDLNLPVPPPSLHNDGDDLVVTAE